MYLELYKTDLLPEYQDNTNASQTEYSKFNADARKAIMLVGEATYWGFRRETYNKIYPPKITKQALPSKKK